MKQAQQLRWYMTTLFLAVTTFTWAYDLAVDGIYYNRNPDGTSVYVTYKTTSYNSYSGTVVVPSTITYDGITSDMMLMYEAYLKARGVRMNTISFYMRNLRAVYNRAVEKGLTAQQYPFRHVYT